VAKINLKLVHPISGFAEELEMRCRNEEQAVGSMKIKLEFSFFRTSFIQGIELLCLRIFETSQLFSTLSLHAAS
jgi:hypothetical protein